jgi:hypothetical protein
VWHTEGAWLNFELTMPPGEVVKSVSAPLVILQAAAHLEPRDQEIYVYFQVQDARAGTTGVAQGWGLQDVADVCQNCSDGLSAGLSLLICCLWEGRRGPTVCIR